MIEVKGLDFAYNTERSILKHIAFSGGKGECIAVLGNNGAGKSTLIKCLNRILQPQGGVVFINGDDIHKLKRQEIAKQMAYVAQKNDGGRFTVFDSVLLGRKPYIKMNPTDEDMDITRAIIEKMGLKPFELRYLDELSGGEMQKVMLARALAQQPRVLMLDEPTSNLDLKNQYEVMSVIRDIAKAEGICVIVVIHDLNLALRYCDRFLFVKDTVVYDYGGCEVMTEDNISAVYGMDVAITCTHGVRVVVPLPGDGQMATRQRQQKG